jgi:uncharacterized protein YbjT (DUF2867 family)
MEKVLLAGASGSLGMEVAKCLAHAFIPFRALVNSEESADQLRAYTPDIWVADAQNPDELKTMCDGVSHVFSSLGKSVSLFTGGSGSYEEIDFQCNKNIIEEAERAGVTRFVYCSILGSEPDNKLHLAQVHYRVQVLLEESKLSYTVIKPTGFFAGLHDLVIFGKKGIIPVVGSGEYRTNPIHHADLAAKVMEVLEEGPQVVEVGGPETLTRQKIAEIVKDKTDASIIHVPEVMVRAGLPVFSFVTKDLSHNLDFFTYVTTRDMIAPGYGSRTFAEYIKQMDLGEMP